MPKLDQVAGADLPAGNRRVSVVAGMLVVGAACAATWRVTSWCQTGTTSSSVPVIASTSATSPLGLDTLDGTGDRELQTPIPDDSSTVPLTDEKPLQAFSCTRAITGKRENGTLEVGFTPTSPADASFRVAFHGTSPGCDYTGELHLASGRLDDGALGLAYTYRCRRSPHSAMAVSCGPHLGSDLSVLVRGNGWGRTVSFRAPPSFPLAKQPPVACQLPFVQYDETGRPSRMSDVELVFDLEDCHLGPRRS
jgi:hypothetical protein